MNKVANRKEFPNHLSALTSEDFFALIQSEINHGYWLRICKLKGIKFSNFWSLDDSTEKVVTDLQEYHLFVETILNSKDIGFTDKGVTEDGLFQYEETEICFLYNAYGFLTRFCKEPEDTSECETFPIRPSTFGALRLNLEKILDWNFYNYLDRVKKPMSKLLHSVKPRNTKPVLVRFASRVILEKSAIDLAYPDTQVAPEYLSQPMLFNLVLDLTRKLAANAEFKRHHNSRLVAAEKSRRSAVNYVDALMSRHESLLVFRLNCFVPLMDGYEASAKLAKTWLKKLANNRRNNALFDEMLGYIWKLDFNFKFGCYLHFIFFYKANPWTSVHELSHQIGYYWQRQLAKGDPNAIYLTEDEMPNGRLTRRFGTVSHDNHQLRWRLDQLIHYLSHKDLYMQFGGGSKEKRFGRGLLPSEGLTGSEEVSESGAIPEV